MKSSKTVYVLERNCGGCQFVLLLLRAEKRKLSNSGISSNEIQPSPPACLLLARNGLVCTPRVVLYRVVIPCYTKRTQTVAVERIHSYWLAATGTY
jgi:hypothetical protein